MNFKFHNIKFRSLNKSMLHSIVHISSGNNFSSHFDFFYNVISKIAHASQSNYLNLPISQAIF